jgi:CheY-like chemotaxis protein
MARVLIVEDDNVTRSILARLVSTIAGMSALAVGSIREARAVLETASPDAAIIDLHLQDGLGFEVLRALDEKGGVVMAIITSSYLDDHAGELSVSPGRLSCMAKPIDYAALKRALSSGLPAGVLFHGPFAPVEYVQIAGSGGHTVRLSCYEPGGTPLGSIVLSRGRVWSAETPHCFGLDALRELVARPDARVRLEALTATAGLANLDRDWQMAILDTLAPGAESRASLLPKTSNDGDYFDLLAPSTAPSAPPIAQPSLAPPAASEVPATAELPATASAAELAELAVRAILGTNYPKAVLALERVLELEPDNISVRHQLKRLYQLKRPVGG